MSLPDNGVESPPTSITSPDTKEQKKLGYSVSTVNGDALNKAKETNVVVQEHVVTKVKHVHDVQTKIQQQIVEKEKVINAECTVPQEALDILNAAARNEHPKVAPDEGVAQ